MGDQGIMSLNMNKWQPPRPIECPECGSVCYWRAILRGHDCETCEKVWQEGEDDKVDLS